MPVRPALLPCLISLLCLSTARADEDPAAQQVVIEGARASQLGLADAASAGSIGQKELALRTLYRSGELLEAAPGLIVSQHSGEGKANQFFLRGLTLDNGTYLCTFVDDMLVYRVAPNHFMIVANASNVAKDYAWIAEQIKVAGEVAAVDTSSRYALIAIQGGTSPVC